MENHKTIFYLKVYWRSFAKNWSLLGIRNVFSRRRKQLSGLMFMDLCVIVRFIKKIQQDATIHQNFIIPYLSEAQHVSGDTLPIIGSLKLHWQPLVFHTWKVVGRVIGGCCQAQYAPVVRHSMRLTTSTNYTSNNLPRMKNQRLPVQF
jgi:hypothetical protein